MVDPSPNKLNALPYGTVVDMPIPGRRGGEPPESDSPLMNSHSDLLDALEQPADGEEGDSVNTRWANRIGAGQFLSQVFVTATCPGSECAEPSGTGTGERGLPLPEPTRLPPERSRI